MEPQKVDVEFNVENEKFDDCNTLVLPGKKNKSSKSGENTKKLGKKTVLSKKKRKKLQKILDRKNNKLNRAKLISDLQEFQVKENEYDLMPSTSVVQTAGRKRINDLVNLYNSINKKEKNVDSKDESFSHRKFKIPKIKLKCNEKNFHRIVKNDSSRDLSVVGQNESSDDDDEKFSESSSSESCSESEETNDINHTADSETTTPVEVATIASPIVESKNENPIKPNTNKTCANDKMKVEIKKSIYITVNRPDDIQNARLKLPILGEEDRIMDAIMYNPVVIICGETGSGKTTQVPQFLYEGGYTMNNKTIGVTEPRRVAAISMSKRVAHELNLSSKEISYQIRFEGNVTDKTAIKFMTDGILMKEIQNDFLLRKYSAIIIDEAHERSLYSDILIGFLSRVVKTRQKQGDPLKLIIMSATLRVEDFTENNKLFASIPPVIKIDSRQYSVTVHFSKRTNANYMKEAFKKVCKIHSSLPQGAILVFLTGRQEVNSLCKMLKEKFPFNANDDEESIDHEELKPDNQNLIENSKDCSQQAVKSKSKLPTINLDLYSVSPTENDRVMDDFDYSDNESNNEDSSEDEIDDEDDDLLGSVTTKEPLYCLPLYSMLPNHKQALVFKNPPPGCRMCVIATNVAETSLTIPSVKYVVDTGKVKNKVYDNVTGISTFIVEWTSKASADQRAGRAGRTSAGHCYRLYSSAVYNDQFKKYSQPEILVKPIDDLMLQMKAIGIDNVANFPFPSPPNIESLLAAEKRLILLEALREEKFVAKGNKKITRSSITPIGQVMSTFPVNPRYSKMLCLSRQADLFPFTIAIISALTVQEIFLPNDNDSGKSDRKSVFFSNPACCILGDLMVILSAVGAANVEGLSAKFCQHFGLRYNAMLEINKLRSQLSQQVCEIMKSRIVISKDLSQPPNEDQIKLLRQLFLSAFADRVAKRIPMNHVDSSKNSAKPARNSYQSTELNDPVFISPHSVLHRDTPQYVVYHDIFESSKMYMRHVVPIEPEWLPIYAAKQCDFSNPLNDPPPRYDREHDQVKCHRSCTFGSHNWPLPAAEVDYPECIDKYRYFAFFLFNGDVVRWFAKNVSFFNTPPILFTKTWAFVQRKVEQVVTELSRNQISSKRSLLNKWKNDRTFLLAEYLEWIQESQKERIRSAWPPLN